MPKQANAFIYKKPDAHGVRFFYVGHRFVIGHLKSAHVEQSRAQKRKAKKRSRHAGWNNFLKYKRNLKKCLTFTVVSGIIHFARGGQSTGTKSNSESHGGIAQLGERLNGIQEVSGSIPLISTKRMRQPKGCLFRLVKTEVRTSADLLHYNQDPPAAGWPASAPDRSAVRSRLSPPKKDGNTGFRLFV